MVGFILVMLSGWYIWSDIRVEVLVSRFFTLLPQVWRVRLLLCCWSAERADQGEGAPGRILWQYLHLVSIKFARYYLTGCPCWAGKPGAQSWRSRRLCRSRGSSSQGWAGQLLDAVFLYGVKRLQSCNLKDHMVLGFLIPGIDRWICQILCSTVYTLSYLIFVIFFTLAKYLEYKIYTEKRQFFALNL